MIQCMCACVHVAVIGCNVGTVNGFVILCQ